MVNKLIVDNLNITLNESTVLPFTYTFSTAGVHNVRIGLDNTNEICAYAFKDCEDLTNVKHIPENITLIKRNAFENCVSLKKFNVPASIEYVGPNVFDGCISLSELKFNNPNPPQFYTVLQDSTICYIPDGSKFIAVENNEDLVKDGSIQYYEKNVLGGYDAVDYEALDDNAQYYYDNWVDVHDHYNTVEERFRVKPTQINFVDEGVPVFSYRDINAGDSIKIFDYQFAPENVTNTNVYIYSNNTNVLNVDQEGNVTTNSNIRGNANVKIFICTEPDYYGTYASTYLNIRVLANSQTIEPIEPELSVSAESIEITDFDNFTLPTINKPNDAIINYSSSNTEVATINNNGVVTITGNNGETTITASVVADGNYLAKTVSYTIIVNVQEAVEPEEPQPVEPELSVNIDSIEITDLNNYTLPIVTKPNDATINYSSSNTEVANIDNNGDITLTGENGETTITVSVIADEKYTAKTITYIITVNIEEVVEPEEPVLFYIGTTLPTNENIAELNTEEFNEWTINNEKTIDMSSLNVPTNYYVMIPINHASPIIVDSNDFEMTSEKLQSIDNYDIYQYELGQSIYKLYFA